MKWLIYLSDTSVLQLPKGGDFLGTVEAPCRYEAQRQAAAGFWLTRTLAALPPKSDRLAVYWPVQIPQEVRARHHG